MKRAIVTASDSGYFDLLLGLVNSVQTLPESRNVHLCVLDLGMTSEQLSKLSSLVTKIVKTGWDFDFPAKAVAPSWFKAMTARPHLPKYFPEYDFLLWLDADTWLCDWRAIDLLYAAAGGFDVAIVPEIERSYAHCYRMRPDVIANLHATYRECFGEESAKRFADLPIINSGVFAMRADRPSWGVWSKILHEALDRGADPQVEQCALNVAIYTGQIQAHFLPAWCNWNCAQSMPLLNLPTGKLFAPTLPNEPISICHLNDMRRSPGNVLCTDNIARTMSLTYESVYMRRNT